MRGSVSVGDACKEGVRDGRVSVESARVVVVAELEHAIMPGGEDRKVFVKVLPLAGNVLNQVWQQVNYKL